MAETLIISFFVFQGIATQKQNTFNPTIRPNENCCALEVCGEFGYVDWVTRNAKTIFGEPKWFGYGSKNRIKIILNCGEKTLDFYSCQNEESFWKVKLLFSDTSSRSNSSGWASFTLNTALTSIANSGLEGCSKFFPFVSLYYKDTAAQLFDSW